MIDERIPTGELRLWRFAELVAVALVLPIGLWYWQAQGGGVPVIPVLLAGSVLLAWRLRVLDGSGFSRIWRPSRAHPWRALAARAALVLPALTLLAFHLSPEGWFRLPVERPGLWILIVCFYPLLSVLPQELIFRVAFTWRYRSLFTHDLPFLAASALCFGLVHAFFGHWISVVLSAFGGVLFAHTYLRHRTIWLPAAEHALYGGWIFTVGLGPFFYTGGAA